MQNVSIKMEYPFFSGREEIAQVSFLPTDDVELTSIVIKGKDVILDTPLTIQMQLIETIAEYQSCKNKIP